MGIICIKKGHFEIDIEWPARSPAETPCFNWNCCLATWSATAMAAAVPFRQAMSCTWLQESVWMYNNLLANLLFAGSPSRRCAGCRLCKFTLGSKWQSCSHNSSLRVSNVLPSWVERSSVRAIAAACSEFLCIVALRVLDVALSTHVCLQQCIPHSVPTFNAFVLRKISVQMRVPTAWPLDLRALTLGALVVYPFVSQAPHHTFVTLMCSFSFVTALLLSLRAETMECSSEAFVLFTSKEHAKLRHRKVSIQGNEHATMTTNQLLDLLAQPGPATLETAGLQETKFNKFSLKPQPSEVCVSQPQFHRLHDFSRCVCV